MSSVAIPFVRSSLVREIRSAERGRAMASTGAGDDLRLFATTFGAGFVFLSVFLA